MRIRILSAALCAGALTVLSAGPAFAAGQVEQGPEHANSECSFSGLNDDPDAEFPEGGRVQSFGQLVKLGLKDFLVSIDVTPSELCNGHKNPWQDASH